MAIYISNDAIQNIPIASEDGNTQRGKLSSNLLRSDKYLSALADNPNKVAALRKGADHDSVRTITIGFKIIKLTYGEGSPEFTNVNSQSANFSDAVESNVKLFQIWAGLNPSGIVNAETVLALDEKLFEVARNLYTNDVIGKNTNIEFSYFDNYNEATNTYTIDNVIQENNDIIPTNTDRLPRGEIIIEIDKVAVSPSPSTRVDIVQNNESLDGKQFYSNFSLPLNTNIAFETKDEPQKTTTDLDNFLQTTPKSELEDMGETYEVSAGESFADIVLKKYYNTGPESIISPEDGSTIFTFPNRTPFPVANRSEDSRFQFYLNFLYYSNTEEIDGNVQSWGMKMASNYSRYIVNELEQYNLYNNNYNPSDAYTALPNYYRFLKHMESVTPSSKLNFDGVGNCLNFTPDAGKKIVIPKRQYVDSIYNLLNYRHGEMLQPVAGKMVQVVGSALAGVINTLESALNTLTGVAQIVKTDAIAVYSEAADFFITGLAFLKDFLKEYWPRGAGGKLQLDLEVTWGIPVATNGSTERRLWRKVTEQEEIVICFAEKGSLKVGGDFAVGPSIGLYSGIGKKKKTLGVDLGAGVESLMGLEFETTYEFPLRPDETMLVAGMMAFLGPVATDLTASILKFFSVMNLEPRQYMTKGEIKLSRSTLLWGRAALGLATPTADGNVKINSGQSDVEMGASKSYGYIDNLINLIPGTGAMVAAERNSGICFKFEHEYENNPKVPELDARMFSRSKIEVKMYTRSTLSVGLLGTFLQKLFLGIATPVGEFFNALNFDRGVLLSHEVEMIRNTNVSDVTLADVRVLEGTTDIVQNETDGSLQFINNQGNVMTIKAYTHLGMFSGDIEDLTAAGTEAKLKLSLVELYRIYNQGSSYEFSFANIKKLLLGFVYQKKVGLFKKDSLYSKGKAQKIKHSANQKYTDKTVETFKSANGTDNETKMLATLFTKMSQPLQYVDTAVALGVKIEVPFSSLLSILEFYLKKLYYRHTILLNDAQRNQFEKDLAKERSKIESQVKSRQKSDNNNSLKTFYDYLFAVENTFPSGGGTVTFNGLNGYIEQLIPNYQNLNFLDALGRFMKNPPSFDDFMQEITPKTEYDTKDIGINDFINYFTLLTDIMGLEIKIEGLLGVSGGGDLKAGIGIATAHIGLGGYAQLIYDAELYKDGQLTDLGINDPLRAIFTQLDALLAKASPGKKIPVRTLFDIVKD